MKPISRSLRAGIRASALALAAGIAALGPGTAEATRHALSGDHVAIYNLVGTVEIVRGTGTSVVAEVILKGPDAGRLEVAEGPIDGYATLRVIYPGNRIVVREFGEHTTSTVHVRNDGTFGGSSHGGRKVLLSGSGDGVEASADIRISVPAGKRLDVNWGHGRASATDVIAELSIDGAGLPVSVTGLKGLLQVDVGSGEVRVSKSTASVDIDTGSGEVDLVEIQGQSLRVDTGSGAVTARGVKGEALAIDTGSGSIHVSEASAPAIQLSTGSGEITVEVTGKVTLLDVESGSGDVSVALPRSVGAQLSIETGSGGIESELAIETKMRSRHELVGRVGDGAGQIAIETGSGTVTLRQGRP